MSVGSWMHARRAGDGGAGGQRQDQSGGDEGLEEHWHRGNFSVGNRPTEDHSIFGAGSRSRPMRFIVNTGEGPSLCIPT
jgi:hypothetical protein